MIYCIWCEHEIPISVRRLNTCNVILVKGLYSMFPYHVLFPHSVAEWTIPTVTGDIPPPIAHFSFTQISSDTAIMFGGDTAGNSSSELYLHYCGQGRSGMCIRVGGICQLTDGIGC